MVGGGGGGREKFGGAKGRSRYVVWETRSFFFGKMKNEKKENAKERVLLLRALADTCMHFAFLASFLISYHVLRVWVSFFPPSLFFSDFDFDFDSHPFWGKEVLLLEFHSFSRCVGFGLRGDTLRVPLWKGRGGGGFLWWVEKKIWGGGRRKVWV